MELFYRIQPAGLGIKGYYSQTSATLETGELADGLHVFDKPEDVLCTDGHVEDYGDEVIVLKAPAYWDNGDVEGFCVNPNEAVILARYTLDEFAKAFWPTLGLDFVDLVDYLQESRWEPESTIPKELKKRVRGTSEYLN